MGMNLLDGMDDDFDTGMTDDFGDFGGADFGSSDDTFNSDFDDFGDFGSSTPAPAPARPANRQGSSQGGGQARPQRQPSQLGGNPVPSSGTLGSMSPSNSNSNSGFSPYDPNADSYDSDDDMGDTDDAQSSSKITKKTAITAICAGIAVLLLVVVIGKGLGNKSSSKAVTNNGDTVNVPNNEVGKRVDNVMSTPQQQQPDSGKNQSNVNTQTQNDTWKSFDGSAEINFSAKKTDLIFTVTDIKHYVATVDNAGNLAVKTTLTGSLAGMAGSYVMDVPYSKGRKLSIGNEFTVHVELGDYNGKTVVGEIAY